MTKLSLMLGSVFLFLSMAAQAHDSNLNSAPWDACGDKQQGNVCSFTNNEEDLFRGTCQVMSDALICVRNQPIIRNENAVEHEH